jgi:hypothetical protein
MTGEVTLRTLTTPSSSIALNVKEINWNMMAVAHRFTPATIAALNTFFNDTKLGNVVVFFGKQQEDLSLTVQFDTDAEWKAFRKWYSNTIYFNTTDSSTAKEKSMVELFWGVSGDAFYSGGEDVYTTRNNKFTVFISSVNVHRSFPEGFWVGDIKLWMTMKVV